MIDIHGMSKIGKENSFWFLVSGFWYQIGTRNYKLETRNFL